MGAQNIGNGIKGMVIKQTEHIALQYMLSAGTSAPKEIGHLREFRA
jgi:hypothetical protein